MMTIKEMAERTGVSVRTLHYYDEIGLFVPTCKSEAGYRLYDDRALERLQQILFFREFDIPLKEIKAIMSRPDSDRNEILQMQRKMLVAKKERMERLIAGIDSILKGDSRMDFTVFNKTEMEEMFEVMYDHMPAEMRETAVSEFGGKKQWKKHYLEVVSSEKMQKSYAKVVEWYGGRDAYLDAVKHPVSREVAEAFQNRENAVRRKLIEKRGADLHSFEVREIIGEYGFIMKQLTQVKEEKGVMLQLARSYRDERCREIIDAEYGEGAAEFFTRAIEAFYAAV